MQQPRVQTNEKYIPWLMHYCALLLAIILLIGNNNLQLFVHVFLMNVRVVEQIYRAGGTNFELVLEKQVIQP